MRQPSNFTLLYSLLSSNRHTHHGRPVADKAVGRLVADRRVVDRQAVGRPVADKQVADRQAVDKRVVGRQAVDSNLYC